MIVPDETRRIGRQQPQERERERRLAAAALADDADNAAPADVERDVAERVHLAAAGSEGDAQPTYLEELAHGSTFSFGSTASRSASPKSVNPSVAIESASPAKTAVQIE